ncbi:TnsA-like heteromeric transposase endonuclease subunit [Blastococcus saxobsidens]|nr:TnsA-like heteromeric transposase endonuclease subunit [Blastococcus saxobsidens]
MTSTTPCARPSPGGAPASGAFACPALTPVDLVGLTTYCPAHRSNRRSNREERVVSSTSIRLLPPVLRYRSPAAPPLWSADATWRDLTAQRPVKAMADPDRGWTSRWTVTYRHGQTESTETVTDVSPGDLLSSDPIRTNTWHARTMTRSGLHFLASTGELQAHESLFERDLLVVLDFDAVTAVASQPFTLSWHDGERQRKHTPDFMIVADGVPTVANCRPSALVNDALLENCAAIAAICVARGWGHALVTDYPRPPFTVLSTIAATRNCDDPYGYGEDILERLASDGPTPFARLADTFPAPAFARAILQRLIWDREVTVDLSRLLADDTLVALPGQESTR